MKKKLSILTLICVLFSFFCGCHEFPEFLPGMTAEDYDFVWVCKEPFSFFEPTSECNYAGAGHLKGYVEGKEGLTGFYMLFNNINGKTYFIIPEVPDDSYDRFWGDGDYRENYFGFELERDLINFFDGELVTLRFQKMTKDDFLAEYEEYEDMLS